MTQKGCKPDLSIINLTHLLTQSYIQTKCYQKIIKRKFTSSKTTVIKLLLWNYMPLIVKNAHTWRYEQPPAISDCFLFNLYILTKSIKSQTSLETKLIWIKMLDSCALDDEKTKAHIWPCEEPRTFIAILLFLKLAHRLASEIPLKPHPAHIHKSWWLQNVHIWPC